jgi:exopolyphosphatase/guanosine-5'-triphosphate,3'-diphosphate pyrophosphatase
MSVKKIAVIDLGTNTFNLLIGSIQHLKKEIIFSTEMPVMLGKGGIQNNTLTEEGMKRAFAVIEKFDAIMRDHAVDEIQAFATSAIRNANNGMEFNTAVFEKFNFEIKTIDGAKEAELIYLGAREALQTIDKNFLVMDIGGGSVEFILGNKNQYFWKQSFEIGALRLAKKFQSSDPMSKHDMKELKTYSKGFLKDLQLALKKYPVAVLAGTSGPFESILQMAKAHFQFQVTDEGAYAHQIQITDFRKLTTLLVNSNSENRSKIKGLVEFRKDLIVVAMLLIEVVLELSSIHEMILVDYALKEGVFFAEN